jgi:O-acetyl-ADP-ribose deacetylase (regulator of RNase III)
MIRVVTGDLASQAVGAVVRPIRSDLSPVDALSRDLAAAAGATLDRRLEKIGSMPLGGAVMTPAGDLAADFIIHVVVMSDDDPQSGVTMQKALRNGLRRAADWALESMALPPLGIGVGTLEAEESARALVEILFDHLEDGQPPRELVIVVGSPYHSDLFTRLVDEGERAREIG